MNEGITHIDIIDLRLSYQQRNFAGNKFSDHVATLNAFQVLCYI